MNIEEIGDGMWAVVRMVSITDDKHVIIATNNGDQSCIDPKWLWPTAQPVPLLEAEREMVEAWLMWHTRRAESAAMANHTWDLALEKTRAVIALRPHDAADRLKKAWERYDSDAELDPNTLRKEMVEAVKYAICALRSKSATPKAESGS